MCQDLWHIGSAGSILFLGCSCFCKILKFLKKMSVLSNSVSFKYLLIMAGVLRP